jgi:hypothetical protein
MLYCNLRQWNLAFLYYFYKNATARSGYFICAKLSLIKAKLCLILIVQNVPGYKQCKKYSKRLHYAVLIHVHIQIAKFTFFSFLRVARLISL